MKTLILPLTILFLICNTTYAQIKRGGSGPSGSAYCSVTVKGANGEKTYSVGSQQFLQSPTFDTTPIECLTTDSVFVYTSASSTRIIMSSFKVMNGIMIDSSSTEETVTFGGDTYHKFSEHKSYFIPFSENFISVADVTIPIKRSEFPTAVTEAAITPAFQLQVNSNTFQQFILDGIADNVQSINLFDITGRNVARAVVTGPHAATINTGIIPCGVYMVQTLFQNGVRTSKIYLN